ncbi:MAG TPA: hypothetical protein VK809_12885 [Bacteroidia bacterium]|jgi:hypothetical protein|nr:hypothetical protein [Bacteroidia bacterium]
MINFRFFKPAKQLVLLGICSIMLNGCATIFGGMSPVVLYRYSADMTVSENGVPLEIKKTYFGHKGLGDGGIDYYGAGIRLKAIKGKHIITIERNGKKTDVALKSKFGGKWLFFDIFLTGPIGIIVDACTGDWRVAKPKYIDCVGELGEEPKKSKHKLKREAKRSAIITRIN